MPEYLAPGVFVEEVPSGNQPIEGVGTSTAGIVGATMRGPTNTPTLVTGFGAFNRIFGGFLDHRVFRNGLDALPYAAQGFFGNGGGRLYVTRIVGPGATRAGAEIFMAEAGGAMAGVLAARVAANGTSLRVTQGAGVADGDRLVIDDGDRTEVVTASGAAADASVRLIAPLPEDVADIVDVTNQDITVGAEVAVENDMTAGGIPAIDATGLAAGTVLRIGDTETPGLTEFVTLTTADAPEIDEGGLLFAHDRETTEVHVVTLAAGTSRTLDTAAAAGDVDIVPADFADIAVGTVLAVPGGIRVVGAVLSDVGLAEPAGSSHPAGAAVSVQQPVLAAIARYEGLWGNDLRVSARASSALETTAIGRSDAGETVIPLAQIFGLAEGSVLEFDTEGGVQRARVIRTDAEASTAEIAGGLDAPLPDGAGVRSVNFDLVISRIENGREVESEFFEYLSLDPAAPRYAPRVVGSFNRASVTASRSGGSQLIRLADLTRTPADDGDEAGAATNRLRQPIGAIDWPLIEGGDDLEGIDDFTFVGRASDNPELRTGIQAFENELGINIIAALRDSVTVQKALIAHCEKMVYRFAVIDSPQTSDINTALTWRRNFDTTRAAIYFPRLVIADRFGEPGDLLAIPSAGHVMGIYARTDIERGVWKAPGNEVVRGILGFSVGLTRGEQEVLNPQNLNCFRDFRPVNRGLRIYGARTASSSAEWRYINVRRLFLFVEQSLDTGLQFAVFEPNDVPLWSTVKQSVSGFLRGIWRDGGLVGATEEEAFFVNVGIDVTMTEDDIQAGRMIVEIGLAPSRPAEFVILRFQQKTREAQG